MFRINWSGFACTRGRLAAGGIQIDAPLLFPPVWLGRSWPPVEWEPWARWRPPSARLLEFFSSSPRLLP